MIQTGAHPLFQSPFQEPKEIEVEHLVEALSHWLPAQGPIKNFVHHNTLHAYQNLPFSEAVKVASQTYGARAYLPIDRYQTLYRTGRIKTSDLDWTLSRFEPSPEKRSILKAKMLTSESSPSPPSLAENGLRSHWLKKYGIDLNLRVHPLLFRLLSQYFDQGIAVWRIPHSSEGFFATIYDLVAESAVPLGVLSQPTALNLFELGPVRSIEAVLNEIVGDRTYWLRYLCELALSHPGWSGVVRQVELSPADLVVKRPIRLLELLAVELIAEYCVLESELGKVPLITEPVKSELTSPTGFQAWTSTEDLLFQQIWHEAFEAGYLSDLFLELRKASDQRPQPARDTPRFQVLFCIDDRECSLRRHLESMDPGIETVGVAGYFAVDCVFQGAEDTTPSKHCPVHIHPKHLIKETLPEKSLLRLKKKEPALHPDSNTMIRGWLISQSYGFTAAMKLFISMFKPSLKPPFASSLSKLQEGSNLVVFNQTDQNKDGDYQLGYTTEEMADRVQALFKSSGIRSENLSAFVVLVGHGASSVNNPYFSAYECGACSGKSGSANARAFAMMANDQSVRDLLKLRGYVIPNTTVFISALHDTTRDELRYFVDVELTPESKSRFEELKNYFGQALELNAHERIRKFESLDPKMSPEKALNAVRLRSVALFEPRPELNHATNSVCIVARRAMTKMLNFNRRAFLHSYDPTADPTGEILGSILNAVIPVCGGINLEYFFSAIDPSVYGSGSKLSHNIVGLVGVANGVEGDLLTGLPTQMTELHEPLRLSFVVEQEPEVALQALTLNIHTFEWVKNQWVRYFAISPSTGEIFEFRDQQMIQFQPPKGQ